MVTRRALGIFFFYGNVPADSYLHTGYSWSTSGLSCVPGEARPCLLQLSLSFSTHSRSSNRKTENDKHCALSSIDIPVSPTSSHLCAIIPSHTLALSRAHCYCCRPTARGNIPLLPEGRLVIRVMEESAYSSLVSLSDSIYQGYDSLLRCCAGAFVLSKQPLSALAAEGLVTRSATKRFRARNVFGHRLKNLLPPFFRLFFFSTLSFKFAFGGKKLSPPF